MIYFEQLVYSQEYNILQVLTCTLENRLNVRSISSITKACVISFCETTYPSLLRILPVIDQLTSVTIRFGIGENWKASGKKVHHCCKNFRFNGLPFEVVIDLNISILFTDFKLDSARIVQLIYTNYWCTLVMVINSGPKNTDLTPSILNSNFASGEQ